MKKCGLRRAFTYGGTPSSLLAQMDKEDEFNRSIGIQDQFRADRQSALQARAGDVSGMTGVSNRQKASALGALAEKAGTFGTNITFDTPRGISRTRQMRLGLDRGDAEDRSSLFEENRRQQMSSIMGYQQGGKPDDPLARAAAMRAKMDAEYGKTATAAAPPPVRDVKEPTTAPVPERDKGAFGLFKSLGERAKNYEHGGKGGDAPVYRDERGVIHGPKGIDRVPGEVEETGEPIAVGEGERILNEEQAEALDHHFAKKGMTTDEFLATATDAPVGPTLRRGLRAAELGGTMGPPRPTNAQLAEALRGQSGEAFRANLAPKPAAPAPAPAVAPPVMEHHTVPQAMRGAAPTPMMEPLTINTAPTQPQGIVDRAKGLGRQVADAARSVTTGGGGGGGTSAPTTRPGMGVPGQGLLAEAPAAAATGPAKTVGQAVGGMAANGLKAAGKGLYKLGVPLTAVTGAAQQVLDPKSETRTLWGNDNADLLTKIAGTLESAGNVAGNALTLGMVPNPVTNLVGAFTEGDTALTRGLEGTGHALDPSAPKVAAAANMAEAAKAAEAEKTAAAAAASPLRDPVLNKVADENTNSVRELRAAGVEGPLQGDVTDPATGKTGRQGIRTIQTMNGNVYAGRDKRGQLNVTAGADLSPEQHAALQNAEAARTRADLDRQVRYFANEKLKSDLASNSPEDRRRGLLALAHQQQGIDARNKELDRDVIRRGQDLTMRGHELEYGAKAAALKNQMMGQNLERNNKVLDSILGGENIKVDGKDVPNTRRQQILSDMNMTLGQHNMHLGHLTPKDMQEFFTAHEISEKTEPSAISKAFSKWVLGKPYVRDFDPHRMAARAQGPEGQSNALGFYSNPNQSDVWGPAAVGRQFLTGEYNGPASRYLNGQ